MMESKTRNLFLLEAWFYGSNNAEACDSTSDSLVLLKCVVVVVVVVVASFGTLRTVNIHFVS